MNSPCTAPKSKITKIRTPAQEKAYDEYKFAVSGMWVLRLRVMLRCLESEIEGVKLVKQSVYAQAKRELGFQGNRKAVRDQLAALVASYEPAT
jgi:hypothetical protein